jgi:subtilisin family serine protease
MKEKHVILRAIGTTVRGDGGMLGGPGAGPAVVEPTGLKVDVDDLESARATEVARHADVLAVAPVMPIKLVEPVAMPGLQPAAGTIDWGIEAVGATTSPFSGDGVVMSVLDTGIDATHAAFTGVTLEQKDFTGEGDGDQHGHGTHCAGTIFGRDVQNTRIGVATGVKKALIGKVLGSQGGSTESIVQAIQWAINGGANVISMSLGMDFPGFQRLLMDQAGLPPELATSKALEGYRLNVLLFDRLAATVKQMGNFVQTTVLVAAAGNESRTNVNPDFKIAVAPPAVAEGMISVAALGRGPDGIGLVVAPFSNTGAMVAGPGVGITSAKRGGGLAVMSGTSMATPHVAGVLALWAEKLRILGSLNPGLLTSKVVASGVTTGLPAGFDPNDVGSGMVQAPQS